MRANVSAASGSERRFGAWREAVGSLCPPNSGVPEFGHVLFVRVRNIRVGRGERDGVRGIGLLLYALDPNPFARSSPAEFGCSRVRPIMIAQVGNRSESKRL